VIDYGLGVVLDVLRDSDIDIALECRNDTLINEWCRQVGLISLRQHMAWWARKDDDPTIEMFAIRNKHGKFLGVCGLTDIDHVSRRAEFSLYIRPGEQLHGYGKMALASLLRFGFYNLNLNRVWGEVFDKNPAMKTFTEFGFDKEGRRREFYFKDGEYIDANLISIGRRKFDALWPFNKTNTDIKE
jgi:RimJ/RimL family protein N-acetyltransferase